MELLMVHAPHQRTPEAGTDVLVDRIVSKFAPDYVYLFGSRARGDYSDESDYDVMVILPDNAPPEHLGWIGQDGALKGVRLDRHADIKFMRRSQFVRQLHLKASMPTAVLRDGWCLYARAGAPELTPAYQDVSSRVCEPGESEFDPVLVENTRDWIKVARDDLAAAELLLTHGMFDQCLFHSQQAIEKAMKALLTWYDRPVAKHHDLKELGAQCVEIAPALEPEIASAYELSRWAIDGRYPPSKADQPKATDGLRLARQAVEAILADIPPAVLDVQ